MIGYRVEKKSYSLHYQSPWAYLEGDRGTRGPPVEEIFALFKYSLSRFCQTTCTICVE